MSATLWKKTFSKEQLRRMKAAYEAGVPLKEIGRRFGVSREKIVSLSGRRREERGQ